MLGRVDQNGVARFSGDINDCRDFLRGFGLEVDRRSGWCKAGWLGMIQFSGGEYHAAAWQSCLA